MEKIPLFFKKYILVLLLLVINPLFQSTLFSQIIFQDGFETGTLVNWTNLGGSYSYQGVTTSDPAVGTYSLQQTGFSQHYQGLKATLPSSQPTEISWRVKSSSVNLHSGYVVIGDNNTTSNNGIIFCYIQNTGNLHFIANGINYNHPVSPNTWYHIEIKNINWTTKIYDIYIDGSLVSTSFPFRSTSSNDITSIYSYNFSSGSNAYNDEFIVTVLPNTPPTAVCQNYNAELDPAGNVTITGANVDGGSSDAEGSVTLSVSPDTFDCSHVGIPQTVTLTVTDSVGLTDSCTATVTVEDNLDPVITCPTDITQDTDLGACAGTVTVPTPTFTDNCFDGNGCLQTDDIDSYVLGYIFGQDPLWPTWSDDPAESAKVSNEQALSGTQSLKVIGIPAGGPVDQLYLLGDKTAGVWEVTYNMYIPVGNTAVTNIQKFQTAGITWANQVYYHSDGTGLYLVNNTLTSFTFPQGSWFEVKQFVDLDNDLTIVYIDENIIISHPFSFEAFSNNGLGQLQLGAINFYPYTEASDPNPAALPLFYVDNVSLCAVAVNDFNNTADASDVYPVGATNVVWTITDGAGNTDSCTQVITVENNELPGIVCPADLTAYTVDGECSAMVFFQNALGFDNCGSVTVYQTAGFGSGSVFPVGVNTVEFTALDVNGNTATCEFTITVIDDDLPNAICQSITVELDDMGNATITADDVNFDSNDNCGVDTLEIDIDTFDCSDVGANNVTLTVTDVNGNPATCTAVVTVVDVMSPEVVCNDITVELGPSGSVTIDPMDVGFGSTDNCDITSYDLNIDTFDCLDVGDTTVILTVTDVNGNVSSCSATITVEDNMAPELVCMDVTLELNQDGIAYIIPSQLVDVDDPCGVVVLTADVDEVSCADIGTPVEVNIFANDGNGNSSFCSAIVTVVDTMGPQIVCPPNEQVNLDPNGTYTLGDYIGDGIATVSDNCTDPVTIFSQSPAAGTALGFGIQVITFTAEDEYGNVSTCSFNLNVGEILGANDVEDFASLVLYPNPADSQVNLSNPRQMDLSDITIYDLTGRIVNKVDLSNMGSEISIDVSTLANAPYLLVIKGSQGTSTKTLIVNNY